MQLCMSLHAFASESAMKKGCVYSVRLVLRSVIFVLILSRKPQYSQISKNTKQFNKITIKVGSQYQRHMLVYVGINFNRS